MLGLVRRLWQNQQLRRFVIVGVVCYVVDAGSLWLLHHAGVPLSLATTSGFVVGLGVNYGLNRVFTFESSGQTGKQLVKYALLVGINYVITLVLVLGLTRLGVPTLVAKTLSTGTCALSNFFLYRHWVFGQEGVLPRLFHRTSPERHDAPTVEETPATSWSATTAE